MPRALRGALPRARLRGALRSALRPGVPRLPQVLPGGAGLPRLLSAPETAALATLVEIASAGARPAAGGYHAPVTGARAVLLLLLTASGCLDNLNQRKYFDKLEAAAPGLAVRVHRHRAAIEQQLDQALRAQAPAEPTHIGYWGETWDFVRTVTDGERLFMRGRMFHAEGPASTYYLAFTVAEDGSVEVLDGRVFASRRSP